MLKILFVCTGNSFRSPVAEALLKQLRPDIKVESAGTNPVIPISESARKYLTKIGVIGYLKKSTSHINEMSLENYNLIVAMENYHKEIILQFCPTCKEKIVVWEIKDPYFTSPKIAYTIFNIIRQKVEDLANIL